MQLRRPKLSKTYAMKNTAKHLNNRELNPFMYTLYWVGANTIKPTPPFQESVITFLHLNKLLYYLRSSIHKPKKSTGDKGLKHILGTMQLTRYTRTLGRICNMNGTTLHKAVTCGEVPQKVTYIREDVERGIILEFHGKTYGNMRLRT